ncbi:hypothetical protein EP7_002425 [Isosphaeraceae bacterium EP7]
MSKFQVLGVAALAFLTMTPNTMAQRGGGAVRTGVRGAVVGGVVGGEAGAATGAKVGAVTGAVRSVSTEVQARNQYQATAAYQSAPRSDFNQAPPQVLDPAPPAVVTTPPAGTPTRPTATAPGAETVLRMGDKPVVGITFPSDWKQVTGDRYISAVSADGQAYAMIGPLEGKADKQEGVKRVQKGLPNYLKDIEYDELTVTKRGTAVLTGTAKGKKTGVDVVFAAGVFDAGAGQLVAAAFVVDSRIEDYYKETIRQISQTIRVGDDLAAKK